MKKITSFTIDHIKLIPGVYVSRKDTVGAEIITTFDIRMTSPNDEPVMNTAEMHTVEHLAATFLRNHADYKDKTIYFGPMGCRTGFYMVTWGEHDVSEIIDIVTYTLEKVLEDTEIPAMNEIQCGNYKLHSIELAKKYAKDVLDKGLSDKVFG